MKILMTGESERTMIDVKIKIRRNARKTSQQSSGKHEEKQEYCLRS